MGDGARTPLLDSPPLYRYGLPELFYGITPAAGADFQLNIDGRFYTRFLSVFARLTTSAAVANRELVLEYRDIQGQRWMLSGSAVVQTASLTVDYIFDTYRQQVIQPSDTSQLLACPAYMLAPGMQLKLHVVNLDVADQVSRVRIMWERFYSTNQAPTDYPT